jgi:hypothetical protein
MVVLCNYNIDPANLYSSKTYVSGIAEILSAGNNVENISNYDERLLQEEMVVRLKKTPDLAILGSSRIMEIGSDFFPGRNVINLGVSHANIHDLVAIISLLDSTGFLPKEVLINVDPFLLASNGTNEWQSLAVYFDTFHKKYSSGEWFEESSSTSNKVQKTMTLFSLNYFKQSMAFLLRGGHKQYKNVGRKKPVTYGRYFDGTICYSQAYMHPDTSKAAEDAINTAKKENLPIYNPANVRLFNFLLDFLHQKGVKVGFVMLPYHPDFYNTLNAVQNNRFDQYNYLYQQLSFKRNITLIGSFDPKPFGIGRAQFYDMYHCSRDGLKTIFLKK